MSHKQLLAALPIGLCTGLLVSLSAYAQTAEDAQPSTEEMPVDAEQDFPPAEQVPVEQAPAEQPPASVEQAPAMAVEPLSASTPAAPVAPASAPEPTPVGQAPENESEPPRVAAIFEHPGVLTRRGHFVIEPSLQYSYSSSNRVSLVGYTVIPAIVIGVIDVREVKRNTFTATVTGRYGLTNRMEIEGRLPYVYRHDDTIARPVGEGAATNQKFSASGSGIGDVEVTARYQLNDGGPDQPYYIGSLRVKSRTGKDPFEVETAGSAGGIRGGLQTELPTGSGFYGVQPGLTVLFPSDPAVFFGSISYLYNFKRNDVVLETDSGRQPIGSVKGGDIIGFNFGLGLALNEKASFSIGYDHSAVGKTEVNGDEIPESVWVQLGTLLLGCSYRLSDTHSLNISLGVGVTRDTPDQTLMLRMPFGA